MLANITDKYFFSAEYLSFFLNNAALHIVNNTENTLLLLFFLKVLVIIKQRFLGYLLIWEPTQSMSDILCFTHVEICLTLLPFFNLIIFLFTFIPDCLIHLL